MFCANPIIGIRSNVYLTVQVITKQAVYYFQYILSQLTQIIVNLAFMFRFSTDLIYKCTENSSIVVQSNLIKKYQTKLTSSSPSVFSVSSSLGDSSLSSSFLTIGLTLISPISFSFSVISKS